MTAARFEAALLAGQKMEPGDRAATNHDRVGLESCAVKHIIWITNGSVLNEISWPQFSYIYKHDICIHNLKWFLFAFAVSDHFWRRGPHFVNDDFLLKDVILHSKLLIMSIVVVFTLRSRFVFLFLMCMLYSCFATLVGSISCLIVYKHCCLT